MMMIDGNEKKWKFIFLESEVIPAVEWELSHPLLVAGLIQQFW